MGDNLVNLKVVGNLIQVICYNETQQQSVIKNMTKPGNCIFEGYEVWEDETVILTFRLLDYDDMKPTTN
jgi:hypothetical protein